MNTFMKIRNYLWLLLFPAAFLVFSLSFNGFRIMEKKNDVVGNTDSACFSLLLKDFHLSKTYGNEYNLDHRNLGDVSQKHKTHHILYLIVGSSIYKFFSYAYQGLGIAGIQPVYSVNALIACLNIGLLFCVVSGLSGNKQTAILFVVLYAFSLNTWVLGSVVESWTFSTTLVLLFVIFLQRIPDRYVLLSLFVGIAMLNNIFLVVLMSLLVLHHAGKCQNLKMFLSRSLLSVFLALTTWAAVMSLISMYDGSLSPLNYFKYTLWFKEHLAPPIRFSDIYFWKVALTNLFINSILSNQSAPNIPNEAILLTFRQSPLGAVSTIVYLSLFATTAYRAVGIYKGKITETGITRRILELPGVSAMIFCLLWTFMAILLDPGAGFLYSSLILPFMMVLFLEFLDLNVRLDRYLLYSTIALVIINNSNQILKFRMMMSNQG